MRVLVTGCTSAQSVPQSHRRAVNFTGLLVDQLRAGGHAVDWTEPSVGWSPARELAEYDHVFVGIASPLALGSLRAYGALWVAGMEWDSKHLTFVIDSPDPGLITRGLRSVLGNWPSFTKDLFSNRASHATVSSDEAVNSYLHTVCERLAEDQWPPTVVPGLPWTDAGRVEAVLPAGASGRVQAANLDHLVLSRFRRERTSVPRLREWALERGADRKWLPAQNLGLPVRELPRNHRIATDPLAAQQLRESVGLLVGPTRGEVWWTPKVAMALALGAPVFTDWHRSRELGPAWTHLPGPHETLRAEEAADVAADQYTAFASAIPGPSEALGHLTRAAGMAAPDRKAVAS